MNYAKIYEQLITRARERVLDSFTETHHILPRCLGGTDDISNLVELTPEEHFVAHQLLVKIYPGESKLVFAVIQMTGGYKRNNKCFGWLRRKISEARKGKPGFIRTEETRRKMRDNHVGMLGKEHSEETKAILREKRKTQQATFLGKTHSQETKDYLSKLNTGKKHSEETIQKMKSRVVSDETRLKLKESQRLRREREILDKLK